MKLNKKTIVVCTASLVLVGGTAFAYLTQTGSGYVWGAIAAPEQDKIGLAYGSRLDTVFDNPGDPAGVSVDITAENYSDTRTYRVTLSSADNISVRDNNNGAELEVAPGVTCASLLTATITPVAGGVIVAPHSSALAGTVNVKASAAATNACLGGPGGASVAVDLHSN